MVTNLDWLATEDLQHIVEIIKTSIATETEDREMHPDLIKTLFSMYLKNYKEIGMCHCYDFCVTPTSRILTCIEIMELVGSHKDFHRDVKVMFLYQVALHAQWTKVQRAAIVELQKLKAIEELETLKTKITNDSLLELINKPAQEKTIIDFVKKLFGKA